MKTALFIALALLVAAPAYAAAPKPLYTYVDPMVGVGNDNQGDTVPGPALPHGSIHPSPETLTGSNAGYDPKAELSGFAQLHTQGSGGITTYGTFLVSPQVGDPEFDEAKHTSPKADEHAAADLYAVTLSRYNIKAEVTPAHYAAMYRFTFPETGQPDIIVDITRKILGVTASDNAEVTLDPATGRLIGRVKAKGYWNPAAFDIWFVAELNVKPTAWGVFKGTDKQTGATHGTSGPDERLGAWWSFAAKQPVLMKVAVSLTSAERAQFLLDHDIPGWDFDAVRTNAQAQWNAELSRIEISGVPDADLRRFYTALYHTAIQPRERTLDQADSELHAPYWDDYYTLWDTYRTEFPLLSLIAPKEYAANVASIVHTFDKFGYADTAFIGGRNYHVGQGGDEVDNIIGEGVVRGVDGIDWQQAYRVTHFNAFERRRPRYLIDGYFAVGDLSPESNNQRAKSGSSTVGYALNDYFAAKVAGKAGHTDEAAALMKRSENWKKVWSKDAQSDGFSGFIIPKYADGHFQDLDPKTGWDGKTYNNVGFYEGTAWVYSYDMLHDIPGMIAAMGGPDRFRDRLQHALSSGLIDITNEPSFTTPWLFHNVGRPDLSAFWADAIFRKFTADAYPGDEDNGAMSSHYVFNRIGFFPKLGSDLYYLHGPRQPLTVIHLENGKSFEIVAKTAGPDAIYIQKAALNGKPLTAAFLHQADIVNGGKLELVMGKKPGTWGIGQAVPQ
ncbi:GH92 family glycosyl hydrolase [Asticcacaulis solisilvae]|uniref:GH92 family glycosyl hydrolase n=1 Tax=Asticcacaulis solisilvae TaxID=1217274 RepID=UPI003FD75D9C